LYLFAIVGNYRKVWRL